MFSLENWKRPKKEVRYLFKLINYYFSSEIDRLLNKIEINILKELKKLSKDVQMIF